MPAGRYKRPPITEAVIELGFEPAISQTAMHRFVRSVRGEYPISEQTYEIGAEFQILGPGKDPMVTPMQRFSGYKISGQDFADLIMLTPNRISNIRAAPYLGWEELIERTKKNYTRLKRVAGYRKLVRMATRYMNRIDIPIEGRDSVTTEDYLLINPRVPADISTLNSFTTRFVGVVPDVECQVIVNVGTVPSPLIDHISLLLDIDLIKEQNLPSRDDEFWDALAILRTRKNSLFEAFITDNARELFNRA